MKATYTNDYLRGALCALNIEKYTAEIEHDFQGLGGTSRDFELGFKDATQIDRGVSDFISAVLKYHTLSVNQV